MISPSVWSQRLRHAVTSLGTMCIRWDRPALNCGCALLAGLVLSLYSITAHAGVGRRESAPGYKKCWAVVVGVNYQHLTGADAVEVPPLGTAEHDAQAIYDALITNYGFTKESSR